MQTLTCSMTGSISVPTACQAQFLAAAACQLTGLDGSVTGDATTMDGTAGDGSGGDASGDRTDATGDRADARPDVQMMSACASATDISMRMRGSDGSIRVTGSITANDEGQIGNLMPCMLAADTKINATVYRYTMRAAGRLRVSTLNDGTDPMVDTIVAVLPMCTPTATALACNDDVARGMLRSTATTGMLMAGQTVFIVVGSYGGMTPGDTEGDFELSVLETVPGGANGPCRTAAPFCDMGLQCTAAMPTTAAPGTCVMPVPIGMPCTGMSTCVTGSTCIANPGSTTMGTCRADGTAGGRCRVMPAMGMTACDMGLACTARTPTTMAPGLCRTSVAAGAECDPTQVMNACVAGASCRPSPTAMNLGRNACVVDGTGGGLCRTDSPRCDMSLECSAATPATCRAAAMAGGACDVTGVANFCPSGSSCAVNAMFNGGTCAVNGAVGTPCREASPRCDGTATCSAMTGAGVCQRSVPAGMPCDLRFRSTTCAMGGVCSGAAGAVSGTCTATVAEIEPNNDPGTGNPAVTGPTVFSAALSTAEDVDCFRVTVPANSSIRAYTGDAAGVCSLGMGADTIITLYDPMGSDIAENDDFAGRGLCSEINPMTMGNSMLRAGTYSVCVSAFGGTVAIPSYYLFVSIVTP